MERVNIAQYSQHVFIKPLIKDPWDGVKTISLLAVAIIAGVGGLAVMEAGVSTLNPALAAVGAVAVIVSAVCLLILYHKVDAWDGHTFLYTSSPSVATTYQVFRWDSPRTWFPAIRRRIPSFQIPLSQQGSDFHIGGSRAMPGSRTGNRNRNGNSTVAYPSSNFNRSTAVQQSSEVPFSNLGTPHATPRDESRSNVPSITPVRNYGGGSSQPSSSNGFSATPLSQGSSFTPLSQGSSFSNLGTLHATPGDASRSNVPSIPSFLGYGGGSSQPSSSNGFSATPLSQGSSFSNLGPPHAKPRSR